MFLGLDEELSSLQAPPSTTFPTLKTIRKVSHLSKRYIYAFFFGENRPLQVYLTVRLSSTQLFLFTDDGLEYGITEIKRAALS